MLILDIIKNRFIRNYLLSNIREGMDEMESCRIGIFHVSHDFCASLSPHNPSDFEKLIYYIRSEIYPVFFPFFLSFFLLAITWGHGRIPLWPEAFERCPGKRHPRRRSPSTSPPRPPPAPCPPRREFLLEGRLSGSLSTRSPHDPRLQSGQKTLRLPFSVSSRGLNE